MKIFLPVPQDGYELVQPIKRTDFEKIATLIDGNPRSATWDPIEVELVGRDENNTSLLESEAPWHGSHALMFKKSGSDKIFDLLSHSGELLDMSCSSVALSVFNPFRIDALDEAGSKVRRLKNGKIFIIDKYSFKPGVIVGIDFFKIPNLRVSPTFCSERAVEQWNRVGINGTKFIEIWSNQGMVS